MTTLDAGALPAILQAFALGERGRLSAGPVASGRLGAIWRLDTPDASWAVKAVGDAAADELAEIAEGAAFQEAAAAVGVPTPAVRRTTGGEVLAGVGDGRRVRVHAWAELEPPTTALDPGAVGRLVAALHLTPFTGSVGPHPWYSAPVGAARWRELVTALTAGAAPFADELADLLPELLALEGFLGGSPRALRTCHRDLWADNVRRTPTGELCVFDFDNAGLADPSQELAAMLVEYAGDDPARARVLQDAYADAGGPGRVASPADFAMPIAQLLHIVEAGCQRWLAATTDADRADNEAWVREFLDRPLTRDGIALLLDA